MALRILFADPSKERRQAAKAFFQQEQYEIDVVENGKSAQLSIYGTEKEYFCVIVSSELQDHSAAQVLTFIKKNRSSSKIILIQEKEDEESSHLFNKMGITSIIKPPFDMKNLLDLLEDNQNIQELMSMPPKKNSASEEVEVSIDDFEFTEIPIEDMYSTKAVLFDIFIKLNTNKYVKILHKGDSFSRERLDRYKKEKGVKVLYFNKKDRQKYIKVANEIAKKAVNIESISTNVKTNMLKNIGSKILEEVSTVGMKPQIIDQGKEICNNVSEIVEKQEDLYQVLRDFEDFDPRALSHSFAVTLFASAIIKQFEWRSNKTIQVAAMACLFHDIGKLKLPKELANKKRSEMTPEELEQYKTHPQLAVDLLEGKLMVNNAVKQIVAQHHEYYNGTGFPSGIKGSSISMLANILCLANDFVHICAEENMKPTQALRHILSQKEYVSRYYSNVLENFIKVFVDPKKITKKHTLPAKSKIVETKKDNS